jgi:hypothetical protein
MAMWPEHMSSCDMLGLLLQTQQCRKTFRSPGAPGRVTDQALHCLVLIPAAWGAASCDATGHLFLKYACSQAPCMWPGTV